MDTPTENSVPSGTANDVRSGVSPSSNLLPASASAPEWDCICRECSKVMNDECCGMCDRREGREFYEICNDCAEEEDDDYPEDGCCGRCGEDNNKGGTVLWNDLCRVCDGDE